MFKYLQFDFDKTKKSNKFKLLVCSFIIIILLIISIVININNDIKEDVKIISSNSRRIIRDLTNYTETMSDYLIPVNYHNDIDNKEEFEEIKKIKLTLDYFKVLKENELKELEIKKKELKEIELKQQELKELEVKQKNLDDMKTKAINLIKSYIPNYNSLINLISTHSSSNSYSNENVCIKELIKINNEKLFERLIHIDYDKLEVSFNYLDKNESYYQDTNNILTNHFYSNYDENGEYYNYSHYIYKNYKENIIKNPIYLNVKDKLEIDYSYTEPDLTEEYNNKSKYFQQSQNDFNRDFNYIENDLGKYWKKYYENYYNDTKYLYYVYNYYGKSDIVLKQSLHYEFIIYNEIFINNKNPIDIYNKHPYKFKCYLPSRTLNNKPTNIKNLYWNSYSYSRNDKNLVPIVINDIENGLNVDYYNNDDNMYILNHDYFNYIVYGGGNSYSLELEKNKGSRMIKHNLTNNIPEYMFNTKDDLPQTYYIFSTVNKYFIEKVYIDFPLISIYDEYEYIKLLVSGIADIYNLPIILPIKFI